MEIGKRRAGNGRPRTGNVHKQLSLEALPFVSCGTQASRPPPGMLLWKEEQVLGQMKGAGSVMGPCNQTICSAKITKPVDYCCLTRWV